ncbi:MAG TPA: inositol monophosphatase family protein [Actinomycetota bacterium]|nr:inositol monophosphatase family protein [Actinomycetota bacterium]
MGEREDLERFREVAARAAVAAGEVVLAADRPAAELKGKADYVTAADRAAEEAARAVFDHEAPGVAVVGEELGGADAERYWLIDPIDGTTNFLLGFPVVGVSVALVHRGRPAAGAVHAPYLGTTFSAARGQGAEQDGQPLRVSDRPVDRAVVGTGFPFRSKHRLPEYLEVFLPALERFEDLRRPGAVSLDLAWVAAGVFDGFFEIGLSPWDVAAGALLIEEAGGIVTDWSGGDGYLSGDILAGARPVHAVLRDLAGGGHAGAGG